MPMKYIDIFTSASLPPALFFLALVALWTGNMFRTYTDGMLSQVRLIHEAQMVQIERSERFEQRMVSQIAEINRNMGSINVRVASIETVNEALGLPLYSDDKGNLYLNNSNKKNAR